jgi:hypothetical protein
MDSAVEALDKNWDSLLSRVEDPEQRHRSAYALHRLRESLVRLKLRYDEFKKAIQDYRIATNVSFAKSALPERQLVLVDKVDAFHQQSYATLAVLCLVLNHLRARGEQQYTIRTISGFLDNLEERNFRYKSARLDDLNIVRRSADYRSKYVDHPESSQLHDWYTVNYNGRIYVVFFIPESLEKGERLPMTDIDDDPESPTFRPCISAEDYYVAPSVDKTYDALQRVVIHALRIHR